MAVLRGPDHRVEYVAEPFLQRIGQRPTQGLPAAQALPELVPQGLVSLLDGVYRHGLAHVGPGLPTRPKPQPEPQPDGAAQGRFVDFVFQPLVEADGQVTGILVHGVEWDEPARNPAGPQDRQDRMRPATQGARRVGKLADITREEASHTPALSSERKYRKLVESMDEGFCVIEMVFDEAGWARDYRFIETNPAFVEQTGLADAEGRLALDLVPTLEREWLDTYAQVACSGRPLRFVQHSPAMGRWFSIYAAPTGEPGSHRVALLFTDVTEQKTSEIKLKRLAAELSEADRRKDRFLATLAHELRNPLAPLRNGLALIRSGASNEALVHVARELMDRQLTQLTSLVSDLLDVARSHNGKLELKRERTLLEPLVRTAVETSLPNIEAAGHKFKLRLPKLPVWLDADPTRLTQILNNLLDNAAKFTPSRGRIELAAECQGAELVLSVSDNGAGLAPEMIDSAFDMFSQGTQAMAQSPGGLGIGLSLVQDLVRLHGGSVCAHSEGPGRGSVFTVRLPLPALPGPGLAVPCRAPVLPAAKSPAPGDSWRVLVADDNRDAGESLAMLLQLHGHETAWARDGAQALEMVASFRPAMLILDIGMPGLSGHEVARRLRQQAQHQDLLLVALTGWGADEDRERSKTAGFDVHLTKPADPAALLALMAGRPASQEERRR